MHSGLEKMNCHTRQTNRFSIVRRQAQSCDRPQEGALDKRYIRRGQRRFRGGCWGVFDRSRSSLY